MNQESKEAKHDILLSFVILNYKSRLLTRECVKGILILGLPYQFEIIVVDNASRDGVCELMTERFGDKVKCVQLEKNIGMGPGNNVGLKQALGKYVMVLNPDTVLIKQSILSLVDFLQQHPQAGIVAPRLLNPDKTHQPSVHRFPSLLMPFYRRTFMGQTKKGRQYLNHYTVSDLSQDRPSRVDWVFGPAFIIRRNLVRQLKGYDERFFLFLEDTDLCRRVWQAGWQVWYVPEAEVVHYPHRASARHLGLRSLTKKATWHHIASWLKYFWKWRNVKR